jgi:2-polyprenyl-3-methyl-5-hydroxy-6-metoxy-1,4-benzoquinol methylase
MRARDVQPEQLDRLPHDNRVAALIHRDILRYNRIMGNFSWVAEALRKALRPGDRVLEIAAGRGQLIRSLAQAGVLDGAARVAAFDAACPRPDDCPAEVEWSVCRAEEFPAYADFNVILSCHFLHQLGDAALRTLAADCRHADLWIAAEPRRHPLASLQCRASALIGFSRAGIGDGLTSIRAGFRRVELPRLLRLEGDEWHIVTDETWLGRYGLIAQRKKREPATCI